MWVSLGETVESALDDWEEDAVDTLNPRDTMVKVDLQSEAFLIPTGEVLGIHSSPTVNRDIVAFVSMPRSTEGNPTTSDDATSVASYIGKEENILVVPCDRSLPRFRVTTRQRSWLQGKKIIIRMDGWKKDSVFPSAHIIRSLIGSSDFALEMEALLLEHSIYNRPFSVQALACLPAVPHSNSDCRTKVAVEVDCSNPDPKASRQPWVDSGWVVPDHAMLGRKDLRNTKTIFRFCLLLIYCNYSIQRLIISTALIQEGVRISMTACMLSGCAPASWKSAFISLMFASLSSRVLRSTSRHRGAGQPYI